MQDDLFAVLKPAVEFSLLNFSSTSGLEVPYGQDEGIFLVYYFDLSETIKVEKRIVTDFPTLFGELGGLYEFVRTLCIFCIGGVQTKLYLIDTVNQFFRSHGLQSHKKVSTDIQSISKSQI